MDSLRRCDPGYFGRQHLADEGGEWELTVRFGLTPPTNATVTWGARAIVDTRGGYVTLDLLPDRQQFRGGETRSPAMQAWLNVDSLPESRRRVARFEPELTDGRSRSIIVIERSGWRLLASQQPVTTISIWLPFPMPQPRKEVSSSREIRWGDRV